MIAPDRLVRNGLEASPGNRRMVHCCSLSMTHQLAPHHYLPQTLHIFCTLPLPWARSASQQRLPLPCTHPQQHPSSTTSCVACFKSPLRSFDLTMNFDSHNSHTSSTGLCRALRQQAHITRYSRRLGMQGTKAAASGRAPPIGRQQQLTPPLLRPAVPCCMLHATCLVHNQCSSAV